MMMFSDNNSFIIMDDKKTENLHNKDGHTLFCVTRRARARLLCFFSKFTKLRRFSCTSSIHSCGLEKRVCLAVLEKGQTLPMHGVTQGRMTARERINPKTTRSWKMLEHQYSN